MTFDLLWENEGVIDEMMKTDAYQVVRGGHHREMLGMEIWDTEANLARALKIMKSEVEKYRASLMEGDNKDNFMFSCAVCNEEGKLEEGEDDVRRAKRKTYKLLCLDKIRNSILRAAGERASQSYYISKDGYIVRRKPKVMGRREVKIDLNDYFY